VPLGPTGENRGDTPGRIGVTSDMAVFLALGVIGLVVIAVALVVGEIHGGIFEAIGGDWFSTEVVGAFLSALGFGGAIALNAGATGSIATFVGIGAGVGFGAGAAALTRLVRGGATDDVPEAGDVIGRDGRIVSAVPDDGFGAVEVWVGGHTLRFNARAELGLDAGTRVHVTGVLSPTAVTVAPTWTALPPGRDELDPLDELDEDAGH
jgi:membrane-bound ClpP family serine protease